MTRFFTIDGSALVIAIKRPRKSPGILRKLLKRLVKNS
jgi:hypothetical protein